MTVHAPTDLAPHLPDTAAAIASARRATVADRYAADSLIVEWLDITQLDAIAEDWRDLVTRVLVPNAFYEPAFALAAAPAFGHGAGALLQRPRWQRARAVVGAHGAAGAVMRGLDVGCREVERGRGLDDRIVEDVA